MSKAWPIGWPIEPGVSRAAEAIAYARARHELYFADFAWGIALLLLFVYGRVGPTLRNWAERAGPNRFVQALIFAPALVGGAVALQGFETVLGRLRGAAESEYRQAVARVPAGRRADPR